MTRSHATAALAALLLAAWPASAQYDTGGWTNYRPSKTLFNVGWQMSQPIGNFHNNYITGTSFRGFTFDWRSIVQKSFSAGVRFNWNRYTNSLSNINATTPAGGTLTGPAFRYADQFAVSAIGHYYFDTGGGDSLLLPYVGLGLGGVWSNSYTASEVLVVATISAIDKSKMVVTLMGPKGNAFPVQVKNKDNLDKIKVGDNVEIHATETMAIAVTAPKKK